MKNAPKGAFKAKQSTAAQKISSSNNKLAGLSRMVHGITLMEMEISKKNTWQGSYYLKADGQMAQSEWIYDASYQAWVLLKSDGSYANNA